VTYRLEDGNIVLEVVRLDLRMLFGLRACASGLFEPQTVLFIEDIVAEFGEGGARGCVIGFLVAGLIGGGRSVDLGREEVSGILVQGSDTSLVVGRHGSGCHGRRRREWVGGDQESESAAGTRTTNMSGKGHQLGVERRC
jgi:hypothetical protein